MVIYVAGFLFTPSFKSVVLIKKNKPEWMQGKLNGVGGKVELIDSSPHDAMVREFVEETGLFVPKWNLFAVLHNEQPLKENFQVFFYFATKAELKVRSMTDEHVGVHLVSQILTQPHIPILPNLRYLIPMAMLIGKNEEATKTFIIGERYEN